ncbi:midasin-like [Helicoverpa zea]|uniref:midasin-like n=1 Tax=Helicoverpa zea TaxID=7113 RepID=UPI001F597297|nr:midasin-like [Helicoverpa zea]
MRLFIFCVVLLAVGGAVKAQQNYGPEYWDYENEYDFDNGLDDADSKQEDIDQPVEILDVEQKTEAQTEADKIDGFPDYQIEDNRSNSGENKQIDPEILPEVKNDTVIDEEAELHKVLPLEEPKGLPDQISEVFKDLGIEGDTFDDQPEDNDAPLPVPAAEPKVEAEDTPDNSNEAQDYLDQFYQDAPVDDQAINEIIEETNKLLSDNDDAFDDNDFDNSNEQEQDNSDEDVFSENDDKVEEDTPEKVYADLNGDLAKLLETFDKLRDSDEDKDTAEEAADDDIQDYEEKYGKPYKEDVVMSWRNAEADAAEPEDSNQDDEIADDVNKETVEENLVSDEENDSDDYEQIDDSNLSQIFADVAEADEDKASSENDEQELVALETTTTTVDVETTTATIEKNDEAKEAFDLDVEQRASLIENPQPYGNDALVDENQPKNEDAVEFEAVDDKENKTVMVDDLSSAELSDIMKQFVVAHSEDLDVNSETFSKHIAPIHVTLSVDEPTVVTSPEYPNPYPANTIIDWIFEGPGTGIELNITDFAVNGAIGDYLLVKPGGVDASGNDGLIFSYRLNSVRKYRFSDVNRMFVRFEAKESFWQNQKGFSFSVKLMWPLPQIGEEIPEPEPVIRPPEETLTLNLAGLTLPKFREIKQDFIELIADMAKAYIIENDIDQGLNTTYEVTQITRTGVCNIQWPEYENCVEVTFGVPLHYDEESESGPRLNAKELDDMWTTYVIKEQFSERLRSLGITEYAIPDDRSVLLVWLVIAVGVLISMAMLAVALWRFNCFEDYSRMKPYGDTDSIQNEKRHLDLYPTPHQTLPPLYAENDYKWADDKYDDSTRVDMGGFANKSYIRDELYDLDSDEDVITPRDRKGIVSPRDFYDA